MIALPYRLGDLDAIIKRYSAAAAKRDNFRSLMQECYQFALPDREMFMQQSPGQKKGSELFDATATTAVQEAASRLQATICPPWRQWSKLVAGPGLAKDVRENDELAMYLEEQTDIAFSYINHSNFATKSHESFLDLFVGTGAMTMELDETGRALAFDSLPPAHVAIEEGPTGYIETTFLERKCPARHLGRLYPGAELPSEWERLTRDKPDTEVEYIVASIYEPVSRDYHMVVFAKQPKHVLYYRHLGETSPVIVFRWSVLPGETWGRGPVMAALPDIKTLNKVVEFTLRAAAMVLAPPLTAVSDGVLNPFTTQIVPNTIIPVMSNDQANPSLKPLLEDMHPELAQFVLTDMRTTVRRVLFADPRRREGPIQSATEVMIEDREFIQAIGSAFGRTQSEFAVRVMNRAVHLLKGIGKMADFKVDGREVTLKYLSPLARSQDQEELMSLRTALELTGAFGPEAVALAFKVEKIGEWIGKKAGVDPEVLRSDEERAEAIKKAAALAAGPQQPPSAAPEPVQQAA